MNRFTSVIKKIPGKNLQLPVIILYSHPLYKMKNYSPKFLFNTSDGVLGHYQLNLIQDVLPLSDIYCCVGHAYNKFKKDIVGIKKIEVQAWEEVSDIESIRLALNVLPNADRALIIMGECFFHEADINFKYGESCTLTYEDTYEDIIGFNSTDYIQTASFEFTNKFSGILYLDGKEFQTMKRFSSYRNSKFELWEYFDLIHKYNLKIKTRPVSFDFNRFYNVEEIECQD